jgi:hypothetical protein
MDSGVISLLKACVNPESLLFENKLCRTESSFASNVLYFEAKHSAALMRHAKTFRQQQKSWHKASFWRGNLEAVELT